MTSTFFSSCSKDDDNDNDYSYQVSDKKIVSAVCGNTTYTFEYDALGRVIKESSVNKSSDLHDYVSESVMSYVGNSFTMTSIGREDDEELITTIKGSLNANGYLSEYTIVDDEEVSKVKLSYKDGYLSSMETVNTWTNEEGEKESYGEKESWTWKDGDLTSYTDVYDDGNAEVYTYCYAEQPSENKGYLSFVYPWIEALPGTTSEKFLIGLAAKHLPNAIERVWEGNTYRDELEWEFDEDGYPVSVQVVGSESVKEKVTFVWK